MPSSELLNTDEQIRQRSEAFSRFWPEQPFILFYRHRNV